MILNNMPTPLDAEAKALLTQLSPATLGHLTSDGFPRGLSPLVRPARMAGVAVTLRLPSLDSCLMHHVADRVQPGHVLVVDRCGEVDHACLGGMVGYRLKLAGVSGVVVDGPVTDVEDLMGYGFPVYHRGVSATTTRIFEPDGDMNTTITVGGCSVSPGDIVIGDSDGLFIADPTWLLPQVEGLLSKQDLEQPAKQAMDGGAHIADLSGATRLIELATQETV